jgi:hypothetical protein
MDSDHHFIKNKWLKRIYLVIFWSSAIWACFHSNVFSKKTSQVRYLPTQPAVVTNITFSKTKPTPKKLEKTK